MSPRTDDAEGVRKQTIVRSYTLDMARGGSLERQAAIGGLVKILNTFYQQKVVNQPTADLAAFADADQVADEQRPLVATAVSIGLVHGYPGGELRPQARLTIAEVAVLIQGLSDRIGVATPPPANAGGAPRQRRQTELAR